MAPKGAVCLDFSSVEWSLLCGTTCDWICLPGLPLDKVYSCWTCQGNLVVWLLWSHSLPSASFSLDSRVPLWYCCVLQYKGQRSFLNGWPSGRCDLHRSGWHMARTCQKWSRCQVKWTCALVTKVSCWWSGTRKTRKSRSTIPNTHWPSKTRPQLYFCLLPNIDLSISTVFPLPPSVKLLFKIFLEKILGVLSSTVTMVRSDNLVSRESLVGFTNGPQIDDVQPLCEWNLGVFKEKIQPRLIYAFCSYLLDTPRWTCRECFVFLLKPSACYMHIPARMLASRDQPGKWKRFENSG